MSFFIKYNDEIVTTTILLLYIEKIIAIQHSRYIFGEINAA